MPGPYYVLCAYFIFKNKLILKCLSCSKHSMKECSLRSAGNAKGGPATRTPFLAAATSLGGKRGKHLVSWGEAGTGFFSFWLVVAVHSRDLPGPWSCPSLKASAHTFPSLT